MAILPLRNKQSSDCYGIGVYIDTVTLLTAEVLTKYNLPKYLKRVPDVGLRITYDIERSWNGSVDIFGDYKRTNKGLEWGSAFKVRDFFERLGVSMRLSDVDKGITPEMIQAILGKQFKRLSYVKAANPDDPTRPFYADWTEIAGLKESEVSFAKRFQKSLNKGYPSNYHPEVMRAVAPSGGRHLITLNNEEEVF